MFKLLVNKTRIHKVNARMCVLVPFCLHKYETVSKSNRSNSKFSERRESCRNFFFETEQSWTNLAPFTFLKLNSWLNGFSKTALSLSEYAFCTEFSLRSLRQFNSSALARWGVICHRDSRDQPQPVSFLSPGSKKEDPGNEVGFIKLLTSRFSRYWHKHFSPGKLSWTSNSFQIITH